MFKILSAHVFLDFVCRIYGFAPPSDKNKDYLAWAKSKWKDLAELKQNLVQLEQIVVELGQNFALT